MASYEPANRRGRWNRGTRRYDATHRERTTHRDGRQDHPAPRTPLRKTVATWTVISDGHPVSWASRSRWTSQPRPRRGTDPLKVPAPFTGLTLEERHPADPTVALTPEEQRALCPLCAVPEVHRTTHRRGALHQSRLEAARQARASQEDVAAALALIRQRRPELLRTEGPPSASPMDLEVLDLPDLPEVSDDDL